MKINENALACCLNILDSFCNFQPTADQLRVVIEKYPAFMMDMNTFYTTVDPKHGMDTQDREELLDVLSLHFMSRHWPLYGERMTRVEMDEFSNQLTEAVKRSGWKVNNERA